MTTMVATPRRPTTAITSAETYKRRMTPNLFARLVAGKKGPQRQLRALANHFASMNKMNMRHAGVAGYS